MENPLPVSATPEDIPLVTPVEIPARQERLPALDLLRGIAILAILPANIPWFLGPSTMGEGPRWGVFSWADHGAVALTLFFVDGKFVTLLSVLFGAGLAVQLSRSKAAGRPFAGYYIWRQVLLFFIGLAHALLLWFGDILSSYAVVGLGGLLLSRFAQRGLLWFMTGFLVWSYGFMITMTVLLPVVGEDAFHMGPSSESVAVAPDKESIETVPAAPSSLETDLLQRLQGYTRDAKQLEIYRGQDFGQMVLHRVVNLAIFIMAFWLNLAWYLLACFLLGIYLVRRNIFHDVEGHRGFLRKLIGFGLVVGCSLHVLAVVVYAWNPKGMLFGAFSFVGALPLSLAYLGLVLFWARSGRTEWLQSRLRAVGRLALSNYLLHSVLLGFIFYGYGLARFGYVGRAAALAIVLAIWVLQLSLSPLWLRYFQIGPAEWLWRSLADRRWRPFLRRA